MKEKNTSEIIHRVIDAWIDIDAKLKSELQIMPTRCGLPNG